MSNYGIENVANTKIGCKEYVLEKKTIKNT